MIQVTALDVTKLAPEFKPLLDAGGGSCQIESMLELSQSFVHEPTWGETKGKQAIILLTAHFLSELGFGVDASGGGVAGPITSEKVGELQRSYGSVNLGAKATISDNVFNTTKYGRQFLLLRRTLTITPMVT